MRNMEQLRTRYQRYEKADKALRTFLVSWQKEHGVTFAEVAEMLEMAQADAESGNLEHKEGSLEDILS
jgi:DNA-binding transcriptional MerR regulator